MYFLLPGATGPLLAALLILTELCVFHWLMKIRFGHPLPLYRSLGFVLLANLLSTILGLLLPLSTALFVSVGFPIAVLAEYFVLHRFLASLGATKQEAFAASALMNTASVVIVGTIVLALAR